MPEGARRLAAIMFTDIVGFTAITQRDEVVAVRLLEEHRSLLRPLFALHGGRVIKTMGDGFLVEFPSALESVLCAQKIQAMLGLRSSSIEPQERIALRIGIHVGEIIDQGDDIVGDAVNVASRFEPLAEPGGICVSEQVLDQIRNKLPVSWQDLVTPSLKNAEFPIRAYHLHALAEGATFPSSPRDTGSYVRLAVLPFASLSSDPDDEFFADGLTEELISLLSRGTVLRVVARTSVMQYKGVRKGIREIGRELSVGSILEGSVRRSANTIRIAVQLIDARTEDHLWVSRFDRELTDIFATQDEIAQSVSKVLQGKLVARIPPAWRNQRVNTPPVQR
ncbi:MAG: adenylate/guanylate cyclase domain-containing protein [Thermoplasmata archaeon]|nr:adenylate/guanylate cyclase domain-containing protein [Thermoplasmata archaeon]